MLIQSFGRFNKGLFGFILVVSVALLLVGAGVQTPDQTPRAVIALTVNATAGRRSISPYIYGLNFVKAGFAQEIDLPVRRWGGNHTTRYNWQINALNHSSDWYFHNNTAYDPYTDVAQT